MKRTLLKSKIHRATVTDASLEYEGSISICPQLCHAANLVEFEKVDIYDCNNGNRFHTYVIFGGKGEICLNGAAARLVHVGDLVIIASFIEVEDAEVEKFQPDIVLVNEKNEVKELRQPNVRRPHPRVNS